MLHDEMLPNGYYATVLQLELCNDIVNIKLDLQIFLFFTSVPKLSREITLCVSHEHHISQS